MNIIKDRLNRNFEYLRISITDKCNYRCMYCMPKDKFGSNYTFLKKNHLLTYEEIIEVSQTLKNYGLKKIRLTGGEPLLRKNLDLLINGLKHHAQIDDVCMTTNGSLLTRDNILIFKKNGLDSITISLDSLSTSINKIVNQVDSAHHKVIDAIDHVINIFGKVKINMVVINGVNNSEIIPMIEKFLDKNIELRFIEYMDVGETNDWVMHDVLTSQKIYDLISSKYKLEKLYDKKDSTSEKWKIRGHMLDIAFISSITKPFCSDCNRARLSADGKLFTCLFSEKGYDLTPYLRKKDKYYNLENYFQKIWNNRSDQYSKLRFSIKPIKNKKNKVEMSYIGG